MEFENRFGPPEGLGGPNNMMADHFSFKGDAQAYKDRQEANITVNGAEDSFEFPQEEQTWQVAGKPAADGGYSTPFR